MSLSVVASDDSNLVVRNLPETLSATVYQDETPTDADSTVNIAITDETGDTVIAPTATTSAGSGVYTYNLPAQTQLNHLTAQWSGLWSTLAATFTTTHDVVGGFYTTPAEVRELDLISGETTIYPTARLHEAIAFATQEIEDYTGASFIRRYVRVILDGTDSEALRLVDDEGDPLLFPSSLIKVTIDGTDQTTTNWALRKSGLIVRDTGTFDFTHPGQNVIVEAEYGFSEVAKVDIAWAARTIARHYLLELESRIPDRALTLTDSVGQIQLAQAGGHWRPTSLPEVNAVLNHNRQRPPAAF